MKCIKRVVLKDSEVLDDQQMKRIFGGSGETSGCYHYTEGCGSGYSKMPKIVACCKKCLNDPCEFIDNNGRESYGKCVPIYSQPPHCSDVN